MAIDRAEDARFFIARILELAGRLDESRPVSSLEDLRLMFGAMGSLKADLRALSPDDQ